MGHELPAGDPDVLPYRLPPGFEARGAPRSASGRSILGVVRAPPDQVSNGSSADATHALVASVWAAHTHTHTHTHAKPAQGPHPLALAGVNIASQGPAQLRPRAAAAHGHAANVTPLATTKKHIEDALTSWICAECGRRNLSFHTECPTRACIMERCAAINDTPEPAQGWLGPGHDPPPPPNSNPAAVPANAWPASTGPRELPHTPTSPSYAPTSPASLNSVWASCCTSTYAFPASVWSMPTRARATTGHQRACSRVKKGTLNQMWCMLSEQGHGNQSQGAGTPQAVAAQRQQMAHQGQPQMQAQVRSAMFFLCVKSCVDPFPCFRLLWRAGDTLQWGCITCAASQPQYALPPFLFIGTPSLDGSRRW